MPIDRHELERIRRSVAMLSPTAMALSREETMRLLAETQRLERELRTLRDGLRALLDDNG